MNVVEIKQLKNSEVEIATEIPVEEFESHRSGAVRKLAGNIELPGFRKGHVPEAILLQKVGEDAVLYEMAELAISKAYPKLVAEHGIRAIGAPEISITKIARGNPLGFKAKTAVVPEVELPDYKAIARNTPHALPTELEVGSRELEDTILEFRKNLGRRHGEEGGRREAGSSLEEQGKEKSAEPAARQFGDVPIIGETAPKNKDDLPPLSDELVQKTGISQTVADFREKIRQNIDKEKKRRAREKRRMEIVEAIIGKIDVSPPRILIDGELARMLAEFKGNVASMGLKPEEYFEKFGKTEDDVKKEWEVDAEKRVKMHLAFGKIAEAENITVPEEELEKQVAHLREHHKDVDPGRARNYIMGVLINEKVFQFLENVGKKEAFQPENTGSREET